MSEKKEEDGFELTDEMERALYEKLAKKYGASTSSSVNVTIPDTSVELVYLSASLGHLETPSKNVVLDFTKFGQRFSLTRSQMDELIGTYSSWFDKGILAVSVEKRGLCGEQRRSHRCRLCDRRWQIGQSWKDDAGGYRGPVERPESYLRAALGHRHLLQRQVHCRRNRLSGHQPRQHAQQTDRRRLQGRSRAVERSELQIQRDGYELWRQTGPIRSREGHVSEDR
jgi:hypothetical protein